MSQAATEMSHVRSATQDQDDSHLFLLFGERRTTAARGWFTSTVIIDAGHHHFLDALSATKIYRENSGIRDRHVGFLCRERRMICLQHVPSPAYRSTRGGCLADDIFETLWLQASRPFCNWFSDESRVSSPRAQGSPVRQGPCVCKLAGHFLLPPGYDAQSFGVFSYIGILVLLVPLSSPPCLTTLFLHTRLSTSSQICIVLFGSLTLL